MYLCIKYRGPLSNHDSYSVSKPCIHLVVALKPEAHPNSSMDRYRSLPLGKIKKKFPSDRHLLIDDQTPLFEVAPLFPLVNANSNQTLFYLFLPHMLSSSRTATTSPALVNCFEGIIFG